MRKVLFDTRTDNPLEVTIGCIPDWDGFDKLIQFVKQNYDVNVLFENDGPGCRRWIMESGGHKFELIHDDGYGNYFMAPTEDSMAIVYEIGRDLEDRLKDIDD